MSLTVSSTYLATATRVRLGRNLKPGADSSFVPPLSWALKIARPPLEIEYCARLHRVGLWLGLEASLRQLAITTLSELGKPRIGARLPFFAENVDDFASTIRPKTSIFS